MTQSRCSIVTIYRSHHITVVDGIAEGEPLARLDDLFFDDCFSLSPTAQLSSLILETELPDDRQLSLDGQITLMTQSGHYAQMLILLEEVEGQVTEVFALPLTEIAKNTRYQLIAKTKLRHHPALAGVLPQLAPAITSQAG